ncbi:hypothetical protein WICPIJ_001343 [Wickerhamomyces pijperi]|uniref:Uncharacterized protein n=1 Tax=Wickerhamomyces pijperi TaxID=599730 RepID=A0A9P8QBT8_WICPI|nr:hypothetical protein WICPIJ_001343 [Wickerhamomyces pijperi]
MLSCSCTSNSNSCKDFSELVAFPLSPSSFLARTSLPNTMTLELNLMVLNLWAILTTVRPCSSHLWFKVSAMILSEFVSRAEVLSSRINNLGFNNRERAREILCFCPPDNWAPFGPTKVDRPSGNSLMNFKALDCVNAACKSESLYSGML